jgi:hypothetical protein
MGKSAGTLTWDEAMSTERCSTLIISQGYIDAAEKHGQNKIVAPISDETSKTEEGK